MSNINSAQEITMPPRARVTQPATFTIGGVEVTTDEIASAIEVLTAAKGIMVKQPLAKVGHPLAESDYHAVANEERANHPDEKLATKPAFLRALERVLADGGAPQEGAPYGCVVGVQRTGWAALGAVGT